jgi:hypothetical protein
MRGGPADTAGSRLKSDAAMHQHHVDPATLDLRRTVADVGPALTRWPLLIGLGGLAIAAIAAIVRAFAFDGEDSLERFLFAYLHSYLYFLSISLGALFFVIVEHLTRSGWGVTVRRIAEVMAGNLWPTFAVLFLPILAAVWLRWGVFPWTDPAYVAGNPVVHHKIGYFNVPWDRSATFPLFFTLRAVVYFAIWGFLGGSFFRKSVEQDVTGDPSISKRFEGRSAWAVLVTFLTVTFASIDWGMSLDPTWFSTMFGVYFIAGCAVSFYAALWVIVHFLQSRGALLDAVTVEHQHDIGKLMFGFIVFWTYITFCQFLLIWYGDIPEETGWYYVRQHGGWQWIGVFLILGHFAIPFFGIMSRHVKRNRKGMLFWCVWMLVAHWIDIYYIVMPQAAPNALPFGVIDVAMAIGLGGVVVAGAVWTAAGHPLVAVRDPRLAESLAFHNV